MLLLFENGRVTQIGKCQQVDRSKIDGAAWLKARLAICVLTTGTLSRYCEEDLR